MSDLLLDWLEEHQGNIERHGFSVKLSDVHFGGARSVNIDSSFVVGTITQWQHGRFEFQFNLCQTGEVLILDDMEFSNVDQLNSYFEQLRRKKLTSR